MAVTAILQCHHAPGLSAAHQLHGKSTKSETDHAIHRIRLTGAHEIGQSLNNCAEAQLLLDVRLYGRLMLDLFTVTCRQ